MIGLFCSYILLSKWSSLNSSTPIQEVVHFFFVIWAVWVWHWFLATGFCYSSLCRLWSRGSMVLMHAMWEMKVASPLVLPGKALVHRWVYILLYWCIALFLWFLVWKSNNEFQGCSNKEGLDLVKEAIEKAGYTGKVKIGMDVAASEFFTRKCALTSSFAILNLIVFRDTILLWRSICRIQLWPCRNPEVLWCMWPWQTFEVM